MLLGDREEKGGETDSPGGGGREAQAALNEPVDEAKRRHGEQMGENGERVSAKRHASLGGGGAPKRSTRSVRERGTATTDSDSGTGSQYC